MSRKNLIIGFGSLVMATLIILVVFMASHFVPRPSILAKRIQRSIHVLDQQMEDCCNSNLDADVLSRRHFGLVVFNSDSLVQWNTNAVDPRILKRRVSVGNDTICNLLSGDYYVKSFEKGDSTYYLFKLVNSTYRIENEFFENRYWLLPSFINANINFVVKDGYAVTNQNGKPVGAWQIASHPGIKRRHVVVMHGLALAFLLLGTFSLVLSNKKVQNLIQSHSGRSVSLNWGFASAVLILLSVIGTLVYNKVQTRRQEAFMQVAAEHLHAGRDADFESDYSLFYDNLQNDSLLRTIVFDESNVLAEVVLGYTRELLFPEAMQSYIVSLTLCEPGEEIAIQPDGYVCDCDAYFMEKMASNEKTILRDGLFYMNYNTLEPNYLSKIKIYPSDSSCFKTMYFEFYKPVVPEGFGYPRLLQEKNSIKPYDYSVANYTDSILVYKYGKFVYPNFLKDLKHKNGKFTYDKTDKHYTLRYSESNTLIISTQRKKWSELTAPFAIFFLLLSLPVVIFVICMPRSMKARERSFGRKLQWVVVVSMFCSLMLIGPVSVLYMSRLYNQKNADAQFEKTHSIALEMENDFNIGLLKSNVPKSTLNELLQHYAEIFFTELNLYALDGKLMATSRQEVFENCLQAPLMDPVAFANLHDRHAFYFTHEEFLGEGAYESAYVPISDNNGQTLAYLNTPYFSSTVDLQHEIGSFMLNYLGIILIMLCIAVFILIVVTDKLNKPLNLIQEKMRNVELDKNNEPINWKSNDEIGALIEQYNQLIVKLEQSANLIARNERESTWREMARQVAHEIKNPLTPMQLSVQYLVKAYDEGREDVGERLRRTANTLLEQMEALSDIASAFSDFAKLPENHPERLDLSELLQSVVNLYDVQENIRFSFVFDEKKTHEFDGDKTNLNRAFGNIVKNAVQAIGNKPDGRITVRLENQRRKYVVTISDNGRGIKEADKKKIFMPNFTTKSSGTGLGLAMVYNIVQVSGGRINFESEAGKGTDFIVELFKELE